MVLAWLLPMGHNVGVAGATRQVETVLRRRICQSPECRASFTVCVSCDRGQRYCSPACRETARRVQRRAADRRYQQSERGRRRHRERQRRYRDRQTPARVTDQGGRMITISVPPRRSVVGRCTICGRVTPWIDPYPQAPRRR